MAKKEKEIKTNAMRILDKQKIPYLTRTYECEEFIDARQIADLLHLPYDRVYKTLVTRSEKGEFYVFVIPITGELDLKKAARSVGVKDLNMLPVREIQKVTGYIRGGCTAVGMKKTYPTRIESSAEKLDRIIVSGGRLGVQIELRPADLLRSSGAQYADVLTVNHE